MTLNSNYILGNNLNFGTKDNPINYIYVNHLKVFNIDSEVFTSQTFSFAKYDVDGYTVDWTYLRDRDNNCVKYSYVLTKTSQTLAQDKYTCTITFPGWDFAAGNVHKPGVNGTKVQQSSNAEGVGTDQNIITLTDLTTQLKAMLGGSVRISLNNYTGSISWRERNQQGEKTNNTDDFWDFRSTIKDNNVVMRADGSGKLGAYNYMFLQDVCTIQVQLTDVTNDIVEWTKI
jgi:hypothetical protein